MDPLQLFNEWYKQEREQSAVRIPAACCLSTIGLDHYPNARFVALKDVINDKFIVCGPLHSRKGLEIEHNPKVALTFWWTVTEKQVRIIGDADLISSSDADKYFEERDRAAQIASLISQQGKPLEDMAALEGKYAAKEMQYKDTKIERPENWGGFAIAPIRIEFLEFSSSRFHKRTLFQREGGQWKMSFLQP